MVHEIRDCPLSVRAWEEGVLGPPRNAGSLGHLGIHSQGTRPIRDWGKGWTGLGLDIVSHLKPVVMTCKY